MSTTPFQLEAKEVHLWRGDRHVLKGLSLAVTSGELLHVAGPNGAGKSTLLRVLCGLLRPEQGEVRWRGEPIRAGSLQFQADMAYASHEPALKGDLTALENLKFAVGLKRPFATDELRASLARTGVSHCIDLPARVLSAGQRRRVALARIIALQANLWLLDEPFANLDAEGGELVTSLLQMHVLAGRLAVVVAHHNLVLECPHRRLVLAA